MGMTQAIQVLARRPYLAAALTGLGYYLAGRFALHFTVMPEGIAIMWPPNAALLAAFLLAPRKQWWMFAAAGVVAEFAADIGSFPIWQIAGFAAVNLFEALFAALAICWLTKSHPIELTLRNLGITIAVTLVAAPAVAALGGAQAYALGNPSIEYWQFWRLWWFGDATGLVVTLPLILIVAGRVPGVPAFPRLATVEAVGLGAALLLAAALLVTPLHDSLPWAASPVLVMLCMVWVALRTTPLIAAGTALLVSLAATIATTSGIGPFAGLADEAASALAVQEFLVATSILAILLSFAISEVRRAKDELEVRNEDLEQRVAARTESLTSLNRELAENLRLLERKLDEAEQRRQQLVREMSEGALKRADMAQVNSRLLQRLRANSEEMEVLRHQVQYFTNLLHEDRPTLSG